MGAGGVFGCAHGTVAALFLLHLHRVRHDVDGGVDLKGHETGTDDVGGVVVARHATHHTHLPQLLTTLLQVLPAQQPRPA